MFFFFLASIPPTFNIMQQAILRQKLILLFSVYDPWPPHPLLLCIFSPGKWERARPAAPRRVLLVLAEGMAGVRSDVCSVGCCSVAAQPRLEQAKRVSETEDLSGLAFQRAEERMENRGRESGSLVQPEVMCVMCLFAAWDHMLSGSLHWVNQWITAEILTLTKVLLCRWTLLPATLCLALTLIERHKYCT